MNVRISLSGSLNTAEGLDALARIVYAIGDGWHEWLGPDPDEDGLASYLDQYRPHRELLEKSYARALLYPLESRRTVVVAEEDDVANPPPDRLDEETSVSVATAAILLTQSLSVLVENEINDGAFYSRLIRIVDDGLVNLFHEPRPRIRFENGGGKTVATDLVRHRAETSRAAGVPLRLLVLADSDARYPGHQERDTNALRKLCSETGASLFVLKKRAIENYVTDPVLTEQAAQNADIASSVAFILSLPSAARDHLPDQGRNFRGRREGRSPGRFREENVRRNRVSGWFQAQGARFGGALRAVHGAMIAVFVATTHVHTEDDLIARDCLLEVQAIARWMREEL